MYLVYFSNSVCHQLRARRALSQFSDVQLKIRRVLSLYKIYDDSAFLVFNGKFLNSVNTLLVLSQSCENQNMYFNNSVCRQLRARRALSLSSDVPLKTRRVLSLYKVYDDSALLVLNGTLLNSVN